MALSQEKTKKIADLLTADKDKAAALLEMSPEEAASALNAAGGDFTADEIAEFGDNLKKIAESQGEGELNAENLDEVAGGIALEAASFYFGVFKCGVELGKAAAKNWKW